MTSNRKRLGSVIGAVLFAAIVATSGCQEPTKVAAKSPTPVHVVDVASYSPSEDLRYSASVLPFAEAVLSFKSAGYVTEIKQVMGADGRRRDIGPGDYVARGAALAQIRHQDLKNQLDQATATLSAAQAQHVEANKDYERAKTLYASESLTKPDFDRAQAKFDTTLAAVDQAKANVHQAQLALQDADLTAPFSGYIIARNIELGNLAAPGTPAFTIADTSAVKISFGVPDYAVRRLRLGQQFSIHLQDDPKEYNGRVTSIAASADEKNRVFAIEVTVPNPKSYLKPGMIASLSLTGVHKAPVPAVPLSAVVADPGSSGRYAVFVAKEEGGKWLAHLRQVALGETHESDVAVDGVNPGEKVVVVGAAGLKDGDSVQVLP
ncbi:MAG TPA: efflux RND transporter periplasmic adaptor subunit [Candidatus Acidoferrum sp.]|nr:efflux RND transporter periplasmic adaptor subunit [Candidatus Acidoferrum sp.]